MSDLEKSRCFFWHLLGRKSTPVRESKGKGGAKIGQIPGARLKIANVMAPDNTQIELIEYIVPKSELGKTSFKFKVTEK